MANKPIHEVRLGRIRAAVWVNETEQGRWYSVTVARLYKDGEQWKMGESFSREDLPLLIKVLDRTHSFLYEGNGQLTEAAQKENSTPTPVNV